MNPTDHWRADLFSKQGRIITFLARDLLALRTDDRLPAMQDYAAQYNVSVGTIQAAFTYLSERGAVTLDTQGKLGSFIREIDYIALWRLGSGRALIGTFPLPYARRLAGLATGVRESLAAHGVEDAPRFVRGSRTRLTMLQSGVCDFAVVSRYAAESAGKDGFALDIVASLGVSTYTVDHVLIMRKGTALGEGMRVGVDPQSPDHTFVVAQLAAWTKIVQVESDYSAGLDLLAAGEIDVAVWTRDDLPTGIDVTIMSLDQQIDARPLGEALIVVQAGDLAAAHLLAVTLDGESVRAIQRAVMARERLPMY
jgi:hypothetical protein